ncbi:MAG: hypothetical protein WCI09_01425 [Planctomycetota bacterium]
MKTYLLPCVCLQDLCVNAGQAGGVLSCPACGRSVAVPKFRDMQALPESVLPLSRPQRSWTVFHALVLAGTLLAFLSGTAVFLIGSPPKAVVDAATIRIAVAAASDQKIFTAWQNISRSGVDRSPTPEEQTLLHLSQFTAGISWAFTVIGVLGVVLAMGGFLPMALGCCQSPRRAEAVSRAFIGLASWAALSALAGVATAEPLSPGGVRTGIFGLEASGNKFVYVFDRSASMAEPGGRPLAAAKRELLRSLDELGEVQQFYLIFYNQTLQVFDPSGTRGRLVFGTEKNRQSARRFVEAVRADGATIHADAIAAALRLSPDAIFLLTDADAGDDLSEAELERLTRSLGATKCMVVQFGAENQEQSPRLALLAKNSGGRYRVLDVVATRDSGDQAAAVDAR